ncbi:VCBS repeat-containing protein [Streptomyces sp. SAJ15]|uniref:FG-GAP repeat domain-containing protein n=1 Tax=Streptomyces sp. SAJ15 TaxID=2011095 RepID=UPI001185C1F5|nr:VCBS repeat-containing protein [Streptomyces sp. SAJ15]TVL92811.1 hypothetical protein CD790_06520 [Streptomyces sp. SAJ15]
MTLLSGRQRGRALARLTTAAIAAALVGTTAGTAVADDGPASDPTALRTAMKQVAERGTALDGLRAHGPKSAAPGTFAPYLPLNAITETGDLLLYTPNGDGGLRKPFPVKPKGGWKDVDAIMQVDFDRDENLDGTYTRTSDGALRYTGYNADTDLGRGWDTYDVLLSPGDLGGAKEADVLARDGSGTLWLFLAKGDGSLSARKKVGTGWGQFTQIAGQHDLSGDGRADIVARDKAGVLWLYKGTGDYKRPFTARTKIGGGWNQFDRILSTGDLDIDEKGRADLVARDKAGALWLYKGTGNASAPFTAKVKIGDSGWNAYRLFS